MPTDNQPIYFYQKQPFPIRLSDDDISFVKENYEEIFSTTEDLPPRKAFMSLIQTALTRVKQNTQSLPKDLDKIKELSDLIDEKNNIIAQNDEHLKDKDTINAELHEINDSLQEENESLRRQLSEAVNNGKLPDNAVLSIFPDEFVYKLYTETCELLKKSPNELLVSMFTMYTKETNAYEIFYKRLWTRAQLKEKAEKYLKSKQQ